MNKPESSVFARFFAGAYAFVAGNASQEVMNTAEAEAAQIQTRIEGLEGQVTALTTERDSFQGQVTALQGQVNTLTTERDNVTNEAAQLREWQKNHQKTTQSVVPGADQNLTGGDDVLKKFPEGSLMRQAIEAVVAKQAK